MTFGMRVKSELGFMREKQDSRKSQKRRAESQGYIPNPKSNKYAVKTTTERCV